MYLYTHTQIINRTVDTKGTDTAVSEFTTPLREISWHMGSHSDRRDQLAIHFFQNLVHPTSCLHHLLPPKRHNPQTAKLRISVIYEIPFARTNKLKTHFFFMH